MKEYNLRVLDSNGKIKDKSHTFQLEDSATVLALKKAFEDETGVFEADEFRLFFRKEDGQNLGLDDDEKLEDVVGEQADGGQFLAQCPTLAFLDVKISIQRDFDEAVYALLGSKKRFEHFIIQHEKDNLELSKGKY